MQTALAVVLIGKILFVANMRNRDFLRLVVAKIGQNRPRKDRFALVWIWSPFVNQALGTHLFRRLATLSYLNLS